MTTYIDDHQARARALLGSKVRSVTHVEALLDACTNEVQRAEDATYDVALASSILGAYGAQLDRIGALLGVERQGLADIYYRRFLEAEAQVKRSSGTLPQLIQLTASVTGANDVRGRNSDPASILMDYTVREATPVALLERIKHTILRAAPAGVDVGLVESVGVGRVDNENVFLLDDDPGFDGPQMGRYY